MVSGRERVSRVARLAFEGQLKSIADRSAGLDAAAVAQYAAMAEGIRAALGRGEDPICRKAPHLAVAAAPAASPFRHVDAAIALSWFEIAAYSRGLGTCWAGGVQLVADEYVPLRQALGIPDGYVSGYVMMFGHPRYRFHRVPPRKPAQVAWIR
jgi:nitroreductase